MGPDVADKAIDATRAATMIEHVKENNVSYLLGSLIAYQLGLLDNLLVYTSGMC
jgi:hypothetical protein